MILWRILLGARRFHGSSDVGKFHEVFHHLVQPTVFAYNLALSAYARQGHLEKAKHLFDGMKERDQVSWNSIMSACSQSHCLDTSKLVFERMPGWNLVSWNSMIAAYAREGHLEEPTSLFTKLGEDARISSWNALLLGYALKGASTQATKVLQNMLLAGQRPNGGTFVNLLESCSSPEALDNGKFLHALVEETGYQSVPAVGSALIKMYGACEETSFKGAAGVFSSIHSPGVVLWTAMISIYAKARLSDESLTLFRLMNLEGVRPDRVSFIAAVDSCDKISAGRWLHQLFIESGIHVDVVLGTATVNMFGKCGAVNESREAFDSLTEKNVFTWTAMINAYARNSFSSQAIDLFMQMDLAGVQPTEVTYVSILACDASPVELQRIHACVEEERLETDGQVAEALISSYARLGLVKDAESVFWRSGGSVYLRSAMIRAYVDNRLMHLAEDMLLHQPDDVDVNIVKCMMEGYLQHSRFNLVILVFLESLVEGIRPDRFMFITLLGACGGLKSVRLVQLIDTEMKSYKPDVMVTSALVVAYGKCGSVDGSKQVFDGAVQRNFVTWNSMLVTYTSNGRIADAEKVVERMPSRDNVSSNAMLTAYSLHERLDDAKRTFDSCEEKNVVSWTAMLKAFVRNGCSRTAVELLARMDLEGQKTNVITLLTAFEACAESSSLSQGRELHVNCSYEEERAAGAGIIHMYGKCGELQSAWKVFERIKGSCSREAWTSMIGACTQKGCNLEALELFSCMDLEGVQPDSVTYVNVFTACANAGDRRNLNNVLRSIWNEQEMMTDIVSKGDDYLGLALLNMLTKCGGTVEETQSLFHLLETKLTANNVQHRQVLWSNLIAAYARAGLPLKALATFKSMVVEGVLPDQVTFNLVLSACSHAGLLAEGVEQFVSMQEEFGLGPEFDHFVCMVDLMGRSGRLEDAQQLILTMPFYPSNLCWSSILAACKTQGDLEHAHSVLDLDQSTDESKRDAASFLLLSNTCTFE